MVPPKIQKLSVQAIFWPKIWVQIKFGAKNCWLQNNVGCKKTPVTKKFLVQRKSCLAMEVCCSTLPPSNKNPRLIFHTREGTRGMEFVTQT